MLACTALMANLPIAVSGTLIVILALHGGLKSPVGGSLLVVSSRARFGLPLEGRFDLRLSGGTHIGPFWVELAFSDRPGSRLLILKDQITEPEWRWLCLTLREAV